MGYFGTPVQNSLIDTPSLSSQFDVGDHREINPPTVEKQDHTVDDQYTSVSEKYTEGKNVKETVLSQNLQMVMKSKSPAALAEKQTLIVALDGDAATLDTLQSYNFDYLSAIGIGVLHEPLSVVNEISALPGVNAIYLDEYRRYVDEGWEMKTPTREEFQVQTFPAEAATGARDVLDLGFDGTGVTIAVVDTGIDKTHPDLDDLDNDPNTNDPKVVMEQSFIDLNNDGTPDLGPEDQYGHGTHVAGIAAGNGLLLGMAPGAKLMNARVLDAYGGGSFEWIMKGVNWAAANGADIISMSLGGFEGDVQYLLNAAVDAAAEQGIFVVIAAGNSGPSRGTISSPGLSSRSLTVGATDIYDNVVGFSSRGPSITGVVDPDIVAPGHEILSTIPGGQYGVASGTSMATPSVSGGLALLLDAFPTADVNTVRSALLQSASDTGMHAFDQGAGFMDVFGAYNLLGSAVPDYAYPAFPASQPLALSPGETFSYQLDIFQNTPVVPTITPTGFSGGVTVLNVESVTASWMRATIQVVMPASAVNGSLEITNGATTLVSVPLSLLPENAENDAGSGTDAGETFAGAIDLVVGTYAGDLDKADFMDLYNVTVVSGNSYNLLLQNMTDDLDVFIQDENGSLFAYGFNWGYEENVTFTPTTSGEYTIRVMPWGGASSTYDLKFTDLGAGAPVSSSAAKLDNVYSDTLVDMDGDGSNDGFNVSVQVTVYEETWFDLLYSIAQKRADYSLGKYYAGDGWESFYLTVGTHTLNLYIDGGPLESSGYDGSYMVAEVLLGDPRTYTVLSYEVDVHTTASYAHTSFERMPTYLNAHSFAGNDTDGNGVNDSLSVSFEIYFNETGSFYIDFFIINDAQDQVVVYDYIWVDVTTVGLMTVSKDVFAQNLKNEGDLLLAAVVIGWSSFIPIYDRILGTTINAMEDVISMTVSAAPADVDGNGLNDTLRFTFSVDSKIEFDASFVVSYAFSTVNETALPIWGDDNWTIVPVGKMDIQVDYPISIFTNKGLHGPFLFPSVGLGSWDIDIEMVQSFVSDAYTPADFESSSARIDKVFIEENSDASVGGYSISVQIASTKSQSVDLEMEIDDYLRTEGYFHDWVWDTVSLNVGLTNYTYELSGRDMYLTKFVGQLEIMTIELFDTNNSNYWRKTVDFDYHVGLLPAFSYMDFVEYADTVIKSMTVTPYDIDSDGLFDGVNVSIDFEVKVAATYDLEVNAFSYYYWNYYSNYSSSYYDTGNYTAFFLLSSAVVVRSIGERGEISFEIRNWQNNWYDDIDQEVSFDLTLFDYVFPVQDLTWMGETAVDGNADGKYESFEFNVEVNITMAGWYDFNLDYDTVIEMNDSSLWSWWSSEWINSAFYEVGVYTLTFTDDLQNLRNILNNYLSDEDVANVVGVHFGFYELEIYDDLGQIRLEMDYVETATYQLDQLDLTTAVTIFSVDWGLQDINDDDEVDMLIVFVDVNVSRAINFDLNYYFGINENIFNSTTITSTAPTVNSFIEGRQQFSETGPRDFTIEIYVSLASVFGISIPGEFDLDINLSIYDTDNYDFLDDFYTSTRVTQADIIGEPTTTTNTTSSTPPTTSTSTTSTPTTTTQTFTTEEPAFLPGFGLMLTLFSMVTVVISLKKKKN